MKSRDFCYWLQGFFELSTQESLGEGQVAMIKNHLNLVFQHEIDPEMGGADKQKQLNEIHTAGGTTLFRC